MTTSPSKVGGGVYQQLLPQVASAPRDLPLMWVRSPTCYQLLRHISQYLCRMRQLGGFLGVGAVVASFVGYIRKALEKGYLEHPGSACCTDGMFEIFVRFGRCLCCLLPLFVNRQLPCPHTTTADHLQKPILIRDDKIKWLDFGMTPVLSNLQPHPGDPGLGEIRVS